MKRRGILLMLACLLTALLLPVAAYAADNQGASKVTVGGQVIGEYEKFSDAYSAAIKQSGDDVTIVLQENLYGKRVVIDKKANLIIDLNDYTIDRQLTKAQKNGEVVKIGESANVTIKNGVIKGGYSNSDSGGGIQMAKKVTLTLDNVQVVNNKSEYGGGIKMDGASGTLILNDTNISNNGTGKTWGGGICIGGKNCTVTMTGDSKIQENTANRGAGIFISGSNAKVTGGVIRLNKAEKKINGHVPIGAGIHIDDYGENTTIKDVTIESNSATNSGGGISVYSPSAKIINCKILNNHSGEDGGGISLWGTSFIVEGCEIIGNTANESGGGIYYYYNYNYSANHMTLKDSTVLSNTSRTEGGGIYMDSMRDIYLQGLVTIKDNISEKTDYEDLFLQDGTFSSAYMRVQDLSAGSEIWIGKNISKKYQLSEDKLKLNDDEVYFHSNKSNYKVEWKNGDKVYWVKGTEEAPEAPANISFNTASGEKITLKPGETYDTNEEGYISCEDDLPLGAETHYRGVETTVYNRGGSSDYSETPGGVVGDGEPAVTHIGTKRTTRVFHLYNTRGGLESEDTTVTINLIVPAYRMAVRELQSDDGKTGYVKELYEGDKVEIEAPSTASGKYFKEWKVEGLKASDYTVADDNSVTFTMPANNVAFTAVYDDIVMTDIAVNSTGHKTNYNFNEPLDVEGLTIAVNYSDGHSETVNVTADMISGFDTSSKGTKPVTITYEGMTTTYEVSVAEEPADVETTSIAVNSTEHKTDYAYGEALDVSNLSIEVTKSDDTKETIAVTEDMVSGYDANKAGKQTLTITYDGKTTTYEVTVAEEPADVEITSIAVNSTEHKTNYNFNEPLDVEGLTIAVNYSDGHSETVNVTADMISGFDTSSKGTKPVTITYDGKTTTYEVTVAEEPVDVVSVASISVHSTDHKTKYTVGDTLDTSKLEIEVVYSDDTWEILPYNADTMSITGFDTTTAGDKTATITYEGKTTDYNYSVTKKSSGGGGGGIISYSVSVADVAHGTVTADKSSAVVNAIVTISTTAEDGYTLDTITATDANGKSITLTKNDSQYSFSMPASKVTINASFKAETDDDDNNNHTCPFIDISMNDWFHDAVEYVNDNHIMVGVGNDKFAPNANTTRAQIVTTLWRLEGEPVVNYAMTFADVDTDAYYAEAVRWAASQEIVKGYSETAFGPNDNVTREQLAAFIYRYEQYKGGGFTGDWAYQLDYSDADAISDWAYEALCWTNMEGLVTGMGDGTVQPQGHATRAQIASILMRYMG